jgi:acetyl esterase/lipase
VNTPVLRIGLGLLACSVGLRAESAPIAIWPGVPPGDTGGIGPEADTTKPTDNLIAGRPLIRLGNVSVPTITIYQPTADRNTGAAIVIFPGGGFNILAMDLEGTEVCEWLNSIGITGVLLKYRVPKRPGRPDFAAPLQDAQRAVGIVRARAREFGIDPNRLGTLGFSAGGQLSAALCANAGARTYPAVDDADGVSCRPDFQILIYPGDIMRPPTSLNVSPECTVTGATPPTFLVMAQDDPVHVENVLGYAVALQTAKVPMELHVYPTGSHGFGLRLTRHFATTWPQRAADWMRSRGLIGPE